MPIFSSNKQKKKKTLTIKSPPVNAVIPRNPQRPRLNSHDDRIALVKTIEIVHIHRKTLDPLPFPPRTNHQAPAPLHNAFHVESAHDRGWVVNDILVRVQPPVNEQRRRQDPWQRNESVIDPLPHLEFFLIAPPPPQNTIHRTRATQNHPA